MGGRSFIITSGAFGGTLLSTWPTLARGSLAAAPRLLSSHPTLAPSLLKILTGVLSTIVTGLGSMPAQS